MSVELMAPDGNPWSEWMQRERQAGGAIRMPDGAESWIPQGAVFDDSPSGQINRQNPFANASQPFVQSGTTGGYIAGIGETIGPGRSLTPQQYQQHIAGAQAAGISDDWIQDFLRRNSGDANRLQEAYHSEWTGAGQGLTREQSEAMQRDPRMALSRPAGTGQTWSGNWFDDPATSQLESLIKNQLNQLTNPGADDPQTQLMDFLMQRFGELSNSNGYSPDELALLNTQALEPIEALRRASQTRELERTARAGYLPTSGLTRLNQQQNDLDYDRMRTQANRDLAVQNINERSSRLNQALNLGQTALSTQRGTNNAALQLSTLLQQLPVQALNQALSVLNGTAPPESLASLVNQITAANNQQQFYNQQRNAQLWSSIGSLIPSLFN